MSHSNWAYKVTIHVIFIVKHLFPPLQPPPTYEESIRQSVELPYNILSPSLDVSSPPSFYSNTGAIIQTNAAHPVSSEAAGNTVLPVWCWSNRQAVWWMRRRLETLHNRFYGHDWTLTLLIPQELMLIMSWQATKKRSRTPCREGHIWMFNTLCDVYTAPACWRTS